MAFRRYATLLATILAFAPAAHTLVAQDAQPAGQMTKDGQRPVVGDVFPDVVGQTYDGKTIKLSDHKGKVVLVDFWATWCGPCMGEMPNVKEAYKTYHDKGFDVFAVSLDNKDEAIAAYYEDPEKASPWPSIYDGQGWDSPHVQRFKVEAIPATFLLDTDGRVISTQARGSELWFHLIKQLDPGAVPPPRFSNLIKDFTDAKGAAREELVKRAIEYGPRFQDEIGGVAWEYASEGGADPDVNRLLLTLLQPTLDEGTDPNSIDTVALLQFQSGDAQSARENQEKVIKIYLEKIRAKKPELEGSDIELLSKVGLAELATRLALYQAASGDPTAARATLDGVPTEKRLDKWGKMAAGKIGEAYAADAAASAAKP